MSTKFRKHLPVCPDCGSVDLKQYTDELKRKLPKKHHKYTNWQSFECQNCKSTYDVELWEGRATVTKRTL